MQIFEGVGADFWRSAAAILLVFSIFSIGIAAGGGWNYNHKGRDLTDWTLLIDFLIVSAIV